MAQDLRKLARRLDEKYRKPYLDLADIMDSSAAGVLATVDLVRVFSPDALLIERHSRLLRVIRRLCNAGIVVAAAFAMWQFLAVHPARRSVDAFLRAWKHGNGSYALPLRESAAIVAAIVAGVFVLTLVYCLAGLFYRMPGRSRRAVRKLLAEAAKTLEPAPRRRRPGRRGQGSPQFQAAQKEIALSIDGAGRSLHKAGRSIARDRRLAPARLLYDRTDEAFAQVKAHARPLPRTVLDLLRARETLGGDLGRLNVEAGRLIAELQRISETMAARRGGPDPARILEVEALVKQAMEYADRIPGLLDRCVEALRGMQFGEGEL